VIVVVVLDGASFFTVVDSVIVDVISKASFNNAYAVAVASLGKKTSGCV